MIQFSLRGNDVVTIYFPTFEVKLTVKKYIYNTKLSFSRTKNSKEMEDIYKERSGLI